MASPARTTPVPATARSACHATHGVTSPLFALCANKGEVSGLGWVRRRSEGCAAGAVHRFASFPGPTRKGMTEPKPLDFLARQPNSPGHEGDDTGADFEQPHVRDRGRDDQ